MSVLERLLDGHASQLLARVSRNGPPEAVIVRRSIVPAVSALREDQLVEAACSESTGMICAPVASAGGDELPAGNERLLVGEREVDSLAERDDRR